MAKLSNASPNGTVGSATAADVVATEWWARYDRQRMARDIYTLLYLVGAPNGTNPATVAGATVYPQPEKIREMAQFAVNYVDALDRDDVITKFEYDDDLSNGWSWTTGGHVVYGIERASLSFGEVQFVQSRPQDGAVATDDSPGTLHKEENFVHQFLHIELRNSLPKDVYLDDGWRLSRVGTGTGRRDCSIQFQRNPTIPVNTTDPAIYVPNSKKIVPAGGNFLIGTHDSTVVTGTGAVATADIYADYTGSGQLESVLPSSTAQITDNQQNPQPQTDLDLTFTPLTGGAPYHVDYYVYAGGSAGSTYPDSSLVQRYAAPAAGTPLRNELFDLVLERRQNLQGVSEATRGDWIEVDRFHVNSSDMGAGEAELKVAPSDNAAAIETKLLALHSVERRQPFDPVQVSHPNTDATNHTMSAVAASKHAANDALATIGLTQFSLWQPHFDRDFTSPYELLSVPLYGNWRLDDLSSVTNTGAPTAGAFYKEIHGGTQFNLAPGATSAASGKMTGDFTAGIRFNFPNGVPGKPYRGWNPYAYQNCWYRLFDFVTVPRRADQQSEEILNGTNTKPGSMKPVFRVPGKINLNTMRDETILAALLDDAVHLNYGNGTNDNLTANRNWFLELLQSRDGTDYFANAAGMPGVPIPNSLVSRPFRGTSQVDSGAATNFDDHSVENGLLRSSPRRGATVLGPRPVGAAYTAPTLTSPANFTATGLWNGAAPHDTSAETWQGLFESDDLDAAAYPIVDHHTRNRILAKIANNSTNKSHVYFVWTAVGYFEAHQITVGGTPRVQIGARLTDIPVHRRFSVVDMSQLENAYDTQSNTFDEKKFMIFQKRLR